MSLYRTPLQLWLLLECSGSAESLKCHLTVVSSQWAMYIHDLACLQSAYMK
jgi:hypothetical protein